jgi:hypothetical protein
MQGLLSISLCHALPLEGPKGLSEFYSPMKLGVGEDTRQGSVGGDAGEVVAEDEGVDVVGAFVGFYGF